MPAQLHDSLFHAASPDAQPGIHFLELLARYSLPMVADQNVEASSTCGQLHNACGTPGMPVNVRKTFLHHTIHGNFHATVVSPKVLRRVQGHANLASRGEPFNK